MVYRTDCSVAAPPRAQRGLLTNGPHRRHTLQVRGLGLRHLTVTDIRNRVRGIITRKARPPLAGGWCYPLRPSALRAPFFGGLKGCATSCDGSARTLQDLMPHTTADFLLKCAKDVEVARQESGGGCARIGAPDVWCVQELRAKEEARKAVRV